ncbi:MAG: PqqD family protein [Mediterranea sp.]|jgi:uncharacterized protein (DUF302 family)|nr:PqqD family protein [Mediterranea sp.]
MKLKKDLVLRHIGREHVIVRPSLGTVDLTHVYTLNPVAAWLWEQTGDTAFTEEKWVEMLLEHYEVERTQAIDDVKKLIENLMENELIEA